MIRLSSNQWIAWLLLKVNRFEIAAAAFIGVTVGVAALVATFQLQAIDLPEPCLRAWLASIPGTETCESAIQAWGALNEESAGKVMAAMAVAPFAIGILLGVPLVGRELEDGTAPFAWALAGSRRSWLLRRLVPVILLGILIGALAAIPASLLAETRSVNGAWSSTFDDADLFGGPAIARSLAGLAVGLLCGAVVGRTLPAFLLSIAISAMLVFALGASRAAITQPTHPPVDIGGPGYLTRFLADNPDTDVRLVTEEGTILSLEQAAATVPTGVPDAIEWLESRYRLVPFGIKAAKTTEWQVVQSVALVVVATGLIVLAFRVVESRNPRMN